MKYCRYHFFDSEPFGLITDTIVESDSLSVVGTILKFKEKTYQLKTSLYEILLDGSKIIHYNCHIFKN